MKFKKAISALAALAMSVSCFAGLSITASADETKSFVATASAGETGGVLTINPAETANADLKDLKTSNYQSFDSGSNSIALIEFNVSGIDIKRIKSAALKLTTSGDPNANSSTMFFGSTTDVDIKSDMNAAALEAGYNRGASNANQLTNTWTDKGTTKIQNITDTNVQKYIIDKIKAGNGAAKIQLYISASTTRTTTITTKANATVGEVTSISPTIDIVLYDEGSIPVNYTVQYVNDDAEGALISGKDASIREGIIGQSATITDDDKKDFIVNEQKYIYVATAADETISELDEDASKNIIKVHFREAAKAKYTIKTKTSKEEVLYEATNFEGEKATVPYSRYILEGSTLYKTASYGSGDAWGAKTITFGATDATETINYTAQTGVFVYASEGENIEGMTKGSGNYANTRASNGAVGYSSEKKDMIKLPAGTYKITAQVYGNAGDDRNAKFYAGEDLVLTAAMAGNPKEYSSETFTLTEPTMISATSWGGNAGGIDDVIIERTAAPTSTVDNAALDVDETADGDAPVAAATDSKTVPAAVKSVVAPTPTFNSDYLTAYKYKTLTYVVTNPDVLPDGTALTKPVLKVGDTDNVDWTGIYDAAEGKATYKAVFAVPTNAKAAAYSEFGKVTVTYGGKVAAYTLSADTDNVEVTDVRSGS